MSQFAGEIAFARLGSPPASVPIEKFGETASIAIPGLDLVWDPRRADVAYADGVLAIATGRARDAESIGLGEARRWLARHRAHGEDAARDVGGGFAAIVVDFASRRAMLWIDRFAIETLCFRATGDAFAFADRARDVPGSRHELDPQALFDYLYFHAIPAPRTIHRDVTRLEAGYGGVASEGSIRVSRYWTPVFVEDDASRRQERMAGFVTAIRRAVDQEAEVPATACFLSGGTDSSTIAGMMTQVRGAPAHAYSIGFDAEGYDEMDYARVAARHFGLAHHEYYVTPNDLVTALPRVAASFDQPFGNSSVLPAYFCALRAREDGFVRMLAGDGGDELFGGNSRYAKQKLFEAYHALPGALRHRLLEPVACNWSAFRKVPGLRQAGGYVRHARTDMPDRMNAFNLLEYVGVEEILDRDFLAEIDRLEPRERQREVWAASRARSLVNRMLEYDWKFTLADSDLPKVRMATRLAGVGVGYPFLSRELTDLSLSLPPGWKVKGATLRWFFKRALADFLPKEILRKKKHGFGLPFGTWLLRHEALRALARDALHGIAKRGIIRPEFVAKLIDERLPEAPSYYGELVWILMLLELWLRGSGVDARPGTRDGHPARRVRTAQVSR
jgi:asparagine synthase (glutamine-hydrolysing)